MYSLVSAYCFSFWPLFLQYADPLVFSNKSSTKQTNVASLLKAGSGVYLVQATIAAYLNHCQFDKLVNTQSEMGGYSNCHICFIKSASYRVIFSLKLVFFLLSNIITIFKYTGICTYRYFNDFRDFHYYTGNVL